MHKPIATLHYLTQDLPDRSHEEQALIACKAGVRWLQLRVKNKPFDRWLEIALNVKVITEVFSAILIINDSVEIAHEVDADGVHLGRADMNWKEARRILGNKKIIGYSTHSFEELNASRNYEVNYFGLGPLQFTSTKENLDPVLGLHNTESIITEARECGITKPIIAIGGIRLEDVNPLMKSGVNGIAISSAINLAGNPPAAIKGFLQKLELRHLTSNLFHLTSS